jgi:hypothetical protein
VRSSRTALVFVAATSLALTAATPALGANPLGSPGRPDAPPSVQLSSLGTYASGVFNESAAEISAHDPLTQRLFVVNAQSGAVDVLDVSDPTAPTKVTTLTMAGLTAADGSSVPADAVVNSVAVHDGVLAVAVESVPKTDRGWVGFFGTRGALPFRSAVRVGALPDMLTFTPDGRSVLVANEGEPADDFSSDPEGSLSVINVSDGVARLRQSAVRTAGFGVFDAGRALPAGVRVFGPDVAAPSGTAGRVARNLEPEYVTVDHRSKLAYVTLQEANAVAVLDIKSAAIIDVWPMPTKNWATGGNLLDASDRDNKVALKHWPVQALLMPDGISSYKVRGQTFLVTANEGDAREWGSYAEPLRVGTSAYSLCTDSYPDAATLKQNANLGRLNATRASGLRADGTCYEQIYAFGGRSFSILTTDGALVFDSAGQLEEKIVELITVGELPEEAFNANHDTNPSSDTRSDDKGVEPEGVTIGRVGGRTYAFLALERIGGVMVYDITDPRHPTYVDYANNRDFSATYADDGVGAEAAGDLGAEGIAFIPAESSPTGTALVSVANEVSGTTSLWSVERLAR